MASVEYGNAGYLPTSTFADVDRRAELLTRPRRPPDHEATERVLSLLADEMATNPGNMLQALADNALKLCRADTAGISLLEQLTLAAGFRHHLLKPVDLDRLQAILVDAGSATASDPERSGFPRRAAMFG